MQTNPAGHHDDDSISETHRRLNDAVWLRIADAIRTRGIGRSTLYKLIVEGKLKSRLLKSRRDNVRGIRLISADSLDELIEKSVR